MNNQVRRSPSGKVLGALGYAVFNQSGQAFTDGAPFEIEFNSEAQNTGIAELQGTGRIRLLKPGVYMFFLTVSSESGLTSITTDGGLVTDPVQNIAFLKTDGPGQTMVGAAVVADALTEVAFVAIVTGISDVMPANLVVIQVG